MKVLSPMTVLFVIIVIILCCHVSVAYHYSNRFVASSTISSHCKECKCIQHHRNHRNVKLYMQQQNALISSSEHASFIKNIAKTIPPKRLDTLLQLLAYRGNKIMDPNDRKGLIPFIIPLARNMKDNSVIGYVRWPTQKEDMDLQIVKTNDVGIELLAMGTDQLCHRIAIEEDFYVTENSGKIIDLFNESGITSYTAGEYIPFLKSGKFPTISADDMRLVLDRYLLTKVGAFPDCYERLANNFISKDNEVSALVTCERAVSIFYGWGHPSTFHAFLLNRIGRTTEAKDAARAAMNMPAWTAASSVNELEEVAKLAGFSGVAILGEMHAFRATDPRNDDIGEGLSPIQVTLDQAAHLMDAMALGYGLDKVKTTGSYADGWDSIKQILADKYSNGGYPDMADFILK